MTGPITARSSVAVAASEARRTPSTTWPITPATMPRQPAWATPSAPPPGDDHRSAVGGVQGEHGSGHSRDRSVGHRPRTAAGLGDEGHVGAVHLFEPGPATAHEHLAPPLKGPVALRCGPAVVIAAEVALEPL